jgi:hypothetical protein
MSDGIFNADLDQYLRAAGIDGPPPAIASDALVAGLTPTEQLLRILGLAANADDPADAADSVAQQSDRDVGATESARAFFHKPSARFHRPREPTRSRWTATGRAPNPTCHSMNRSTRSPIPTSVTPGPVAVATARRAVPE